MKVIELMASQGTISKEDMSLVLVTDDINEAMNHIKTFIKSNYQIRIRKYFWD
jgi:predicted Rossmann-fold nucleotide-binding protein